MNNVDDYCPPFEDMVAWLERYKADSRKSWSAISADSGIPPGTLSGVKANNYPGNPDNIARRLYQFKQKVESQAARQHLVLDGPRFVETPSARRILFLLEVAQLGRITVAAMGPGTSKSMSADHYRSSMGGTVWLVTLRKSNGHLAGMIREVVAAMGLMTKTSYTSQLSAHVVEHVRNKRGLIIVDEANHADLEALEELRGWHDETGVGIMLLGNEELMLRIRGSRNRHAYARLSSRIANYHIQDLPLESDITTYLDAAEIVETDMRRQLIEVGLSPGSGGLRDVHMVLETANMLAIGDDTVLTAKHIEEAIRSRATSTMRRAA